MPGRIELPNDFCDLLAEFARADAQYLVIGGYAVGYHDRPRTTKDIDLLLGSSPENIARACAALAKFGAPKSVVDDLLAAGLDEIVWLGEPPLRVDFLKEAPGVSFVEAYPRRVSEVWQGVRVNIVGLDDLIAAKRAAGRDRDLLDLRHLERIRSELDK